ncbi:MAG TPA: hypothetical protein VIS73_11330 [Rhodocyclaceae bacterium]
MPGYINLYDPALRRPREWVTLNSLALAAGVLLVLMLALGAGLRWDAARADGQRQALEADMAALSGEMAAVSAPAGALAEMRRKIAETRAALTRKSEVIEVLQRGGMLRSDAFSGYLAGLSRRDVDGLWLTGFSIGPGPLAMEIRGRVSTSSALPAYLDQLGSDTAFAGRSFASLAVARGSSSEGDGRPYYADFVLKAELPADPSASRGGGK